MLHRYVTICCAWALLWAAVTIGVVLGDRSYAGAQGGDLTEIFNARDLTGWDGDPNLWSVRDGAIVGEVEPEHRQQNHSYLIWQGATVRDFELRVTLRSSAGNSGIDYRAEQVHQGRDGQHLRWTIQGYQADIAQGWMGSLYNWGKPGAQPSQFVVVQGQPEATTTVGSVVDKDILYGAGYYRPDQWNEFMVIARGSHIVQRINDYPVVEFIDNSSGARAEGLLGLQVHSGRGPQNHQFKDISIKRLTNNFGRAKCLFDGKDLTGWAFSGPEAKDAWTVENGALLVKNDSQAHIYTQANYANYVLRFQYRASDKGTSGVALRLRSTQEAQPTKGILIYGSGGDFHRIEPMGGFSLRVARLRVRPFRRMPDGFWNECEIVLNKGELHVTVNGVLRATAADCEESTGRIGLQVRWGRAQFRNIVLIPILDLLTKL